MHDFQGYFSRTFQVLEFSRNKSRTFRRGMGTLQIAVEKYILFISSQDLHMNRDPLSSASNELILFNPRLIVTDNTATYECLDSSGGTQTEQTLHVKNRLSEKHNL